MTSAAVAMAAAQRYRGAGTVEFVFDDDTGEFFFLEMNTRIQVEHPVTEMVTGLDLVALQLRLAAGEMPGLTQAEVAHAGHAIEMRLYAENPSKNFLPAAGTLKRLVFPEAGRHVRIETGVREGDAVSSFYDPMIAKLVVWGSTRAEAIERAAQALACTVVEGPACNLQFLRRVIAHPAFTAGQTRTSFIDAHRADLLAA